MIIVKSNGYHSRQPMKKTNQIQKEREKEREKKKRHPQHSTHLIFFLHVHSGAINKIASCPFIGENTLLYNRILFSVIYSNCFYDDLMLCYVFVSFFFSEYQRMNRCVPNFETEDDYLFPASSNLKRHKKSTM